MKWDCKYFRRVNICLLGKLVVAEHWICKIFVNSLLKKRIEFIWVIFQPLIQTCYEVFSVIDPHHHQMVTTMFQRFKFLKNFLVKRQLIKTELLHIQLKLFKLNARILLNFNSIEIKLTRRLTDCTRCFRNIDIIS